MSPPDYPETARYAHRKHLTYFAKTVELVVGMWQLHWGSIREVGSHDHGVLPLILDHDDMQNEVERAHAVDLERVPEDPRILSSIADYFKASYDPVDVTVCLHVIEHLEDPGEGFDKLFRDTRELLVVGGPYMEAPTRPEHTLPQFPSTHHVHHRHFEIDEERVNDWAEKPADFFTVHEDRWVAAYLRSWR